MEKKFLFRKIIFADFWKQKLNFKKNNADKAKQKNHLFLHFPTC